MLSFKKRNLEILPLVKFDFKIFLKKYPKKLLTKSFVSCIQIRFSLSQTCLAVLDWTFSVLFIQRLLLNKKWIHYLSIRLHKQCIKIYLAAVFTLPLNIPSWILWLAVLPEITINNKAKTFAAVKISCMRVADLTLKQLIAVNNARLRKENIVNGRLIACKSTRFLFTNIHLKETK